MWLLSQWSNIAFTIDIALKQPQNHSGHTQISDLFSWKTDLFF